MGVTVAAVRTWAACTWALGWGWAWSWTGEGSGICCWSESFCRKAMRAASLAAAIDLSCTRISCSRFNRFISCIFHASSLTTLSCSRFSTASRNRFCNSSCLSITSFINLSKKSFHFLFLFLLPINSSSDDVDEDDD